MRKIRLLSNLDFIVWRHCYSEDLLVAAETIDRDYVQELFVLCNCDTGKVFTRPTNYANDWQVCLDPDYLEKFRKIAATNKF